MMDVHQIIIEKIVFRDVMDGYIFLYVDAWERPVTDFIYSSR